MSAALEAILGRLHLVTRSGSGFMALCPAHDDHNASLSLTDGEKGVVIKCHAGCSADSILGEIGLTMSQLFFDSRSDRTPSIQPSITAVYPYVDEHGTLLSEVLRYEPKNFRQRKPDGKGGYTWNVNGVRRVLYHLPDVLRASEVLLLEGEKDCDRASTLGFVATCNIGGAGKWRQEYSEFFRGKAVAIIPDADEVGRKHAREVATALHLIARSIKLLELPHGKDLSEWVEAGGGRTQLQELIRQTDEWKPDGLATHGFALIGIGDLLSRPDVATEYVVEGLLIEGTVAAIVAKPKVGKSTLLRQMCLCVARGEPFLGRKTKQGECIYLALEERQQDIKNDFLAMGALGTEPISIHAAAGPEEGIRALCALVRQRRPVLVVIDPLFRLARIRDEKAYSETYAALGPLIDAAREVGTLIVVAHHAGKNMKADAIDAPLGSTALGGAVCTLIVLKRTDAIRTIQTVQRVGADLPETTLEFNPESRRICLGQEKSQSIKRNVEKLILDYLENVDAAKTEDEIMDAVEGAQAAKRTALRGLVADGGAIREGEGKKGNPFTYRFSYCRTPLGARTSVRESKIRPNPHANVEDKLVRENGSDAESPVQQQQDAGRLLFCDPPEDRFGQAAASLFSSIGQSVSTPRGIGRLETVHAARCEVVLDSAPDAVAVFEPGEVAPLDSEATSGLNRDENHRSDQ